MQYVVRGKILQLRPKTTQSAFLVRADSSKSLGQPTKRKGFMCHFSWSHHQQQNHPPQLYIISKMRKLMHCLEHIDELVDSSAEKVKTTENQRLAEVELFASIAAFSTNRTKRCFGQRRPLDMVNDEGRLIH